jgi:hypothetical protein
MTLYIWVDLPPPCVIWWHCRPPPLRVSGIIWITPMLPRKANKIFTLKSKGLETEGICNKTVSIRKTMKYRIYDISNIVYLHLLNTKSSISWVNCHFFEWTPICDVNFINILCSHFSYESLLSTFYMLRVWLWTNFCTKYLSIKCWWNWHQMCDGFRQAKAEASGIFWGS